MRSRTFFFGGLLVLGLAAPALALPPPSLKVGEERAYQAQSPHPYPAGTSSRPGVWRDSVTSAGATFLRVHFIRLDLAPGDYVTVANPRGTESFTYTGRGPRGDGDVWSFTVDGDTAIVTLHAGADSQGRHGYTIDRVAHGTRSFAPTPEVVCGTDGREAMACHPELDAQQRPVARLLFQVGGGTYLCTGWLIAGANADTMITNNHCFGTQTEVNTVQARFNYQYASCTTTVIDAYTNYAGGTFLKTNTEKAGKRTGGLDYTLFTLQGAPSATYGQLVGSTKALSAGTDINFIQHPNGNPKQVGYWEDDAHTLRCKINTVGQTYGSSARNSQIGYGCDSEGGSSGSPIIEAATGRAVALHHYGNVSSNQCLNSATMMDKICADAGSLLSCASN